MFLATRTFLNGFLLACSKKRLVKFPHILNSELSRKEKYGSGFVLGKWILMQCYLIASSQSSNGNHIIHQVILIHHHKNYESLIDNL